MAITRGGRRIGTTYNVSIDTALTNTMVTDITGGAGTLYSVDVDAGAGNLFLKFYDATAPVLGTTVPLMGFLIPSGTNFTLSLPEGIPFANSISYAATSTSSDASETGGYGATSTIRLVASNS
tara:strand:+ start:529 stop:897 length:369 start_codon:yes stop_codon:yes gene_type:complete